MTWAKGTQLLCLAGLLSLTGVAQRGTAHFTQAKPHPPAPPKQSKPNNPGAQKPAPKMGDWLNGHKNLSADEQEKLLEKDPQFKSLPPDRQAALRERLRKFNSLTPEQRERALNRMQFMANLTPEQRQEIRDANQTLQGLPQERQVMVHKALRHLRQMTPDERAQAMSDERFQNTFSEQERGILSKLAAINPPEGGPNPPVQQTPANQGPK
jgi:hypothetical protein